MGGEGGREGVSEVGGGGEAADEEREAHTKCVG